MFNQASEQYIQDFDLLKYVYLDSTKFKEHAFRQRFFLANALTRNLIIPQLTNTTRPKTVAVIGGTNVGKSTITNTILGKTCAGTNMESAHTQNATAFVSEEMVNIFGQLEHAFHGYRLGDRYEQGRQSGGQTYFLHQSPDYNFNFVLWDTPDVDSIDASEYVDAALEAITLADLVVFVTTQQKYNDEILVKLKATILEIGTPMIVAFNRFTAQHQALPNKLRKIVQKQLQSHQAIDNLLNIIEINQVDEMEVEQLYDLPQVQKLRTEINNFINKLPDEQPRLIGIRKQQVINYVSESISDLTRPVVAAYEALSTWEDMIEQATNDLNQFYAHNYLDNDKKYDAFKEVMVVLVAKIRSGSTSLNVANEIQKLIPTRWAMKKMGNAFQAGKRKIQNRNAEKDGKTTVTIEPKGKITLRNASVELHTTITNSIDTKVMSNDTNQFWRDLATTWTVTKHNLANEFDEKLEQHWQATQVEIQKTATEIHEDLRDNPQKYELMKTTLIGIEVGSIGTSITLIISTGGAAAFFGPEDIVITAVTPLISEGLISTLGKRKVQRKKEDLQGYLRHTLEHYIEENFIIPLTEIGEKALKKSVGVVPPEERDQIRVLETRMRYLLQQV